MSFAEILRATMESSGFAALTVQQAVMLGISFVLFYLAIVKKFEPLLLVPIAFGMMLANLPGAGLMFDARAAAEAELAAARAALEAGSGSVEAVKFSANLTKHPVCLSSEGELSVEMEKILKRMPGAEGAPEAKVVLEINHAHKITEKLFKLFAEDKEALKSYAKILYSEACLIGGVSIDDPGEFAELISNLMI